jgi:hypothetical protein
MIVVDGNGGSPRRARCLTMRPILSRATHP